MDKKHKAMYGRAVAAHKRQQKRAAPAFYRKRDPRTAGEWQQLAVYLGVKDGQTLREQTALADSVIEEIIEEEARARRNPAVQPIGRVTQAVVRKNLRTGATRATVEWIDAAGEKNRVEDRLDSPGMHPFLDSARRQNVPVQVVIVR